MLRSQGISFAAATLLAGCLGLSLDARTASAQAGVAFPACAALADFESADFGDSTTIDNQWYPLIPGTQYVLHGFANRGGGELPHTVTFTVTDRTTIVDGVDTVVVLDEDVNQGVLSEIELAFFAQDGEHNVWSLGEYPEEFDEASGGFIAPSVWFAGEGEGEPAQAGVLVPGDPSKGTRWHLQGWSADIEFLDCGKVFKTHQTLGNENCAEGVCSGVIVEKERSPLARKGGIQYKYYAPGVGLVQIGAVGDKENETLRLVELTDVSGTAEWSRVLAEVDRLFGNACDAGYDLLCP
jgi:hypothetical protein